MWNKKSGYMQGAHQIGLFLVLLFVLCFVWAFVRGVEADLHLRLFRLSYFGFEEMNAVGFIVGAVQTYIWGYVFVGLWSLSNMIAGKK
jgi:hypothetical protein